MSCFKNNKGLKHFLKLLLGYETFLLFIYFSELFVIQSINLKDATQGFLLKLLLQNGQMCRNQTNASFLTSASLTALNSLEFFQV